tara:strand:- start:1086 stop:1469 length:384 start_codon:yes stop_codon:yes gene_type:complete
MEGDEQIINFYNDDLNILENKINLYINKFELLLKSKIEYSIFICKVHEEFEFMGEMIDLVITQFTDKIEDKTKNFILEVGEEKSEKLSEIFSEKLDKMNMELGKKLDNVKKRMEITISVRTAQEMQK